MTWHDMSRYDTVRQGMTHCYERKGAQTTAARRGEQVGGGGGEFVNNLARCPQKFEQSKNISEHLQKNKIAEFWTLH